MTRFNSALSSLRRTRSRLQVQQLEDRTVPAAIFFENFDGVGIPTLPPGWTTASTGNAVAWTTDANNSFSPPNAAYSGLGSNNPDETAITSPPITISGLNPQLTFQNSYDLELGSTAGVGFDMAYLEISVNGGAFVDLQNAGGVFLAGGYNNVADTSGSFGNLFPGRVGWSGLSGGGIIGPNYEACVVDLTNVVQNRDVVQFRWRVVSDSIFRSPGERIDNVSVDVTPVNGAELVAIGSDAAAPGTVSVYQGGINPLTTVSPFPLFAGGIRVSTGDFNGDGVQDFVAAAGPGGGPAVVMYNGATFQEIRRFFAYDPNFAGGVYVATGDVNGDGFADVITGAGAGGGPHVKAFDGRTGAVLSSFFAFAPTSTFGVSVASMDSNKDGFAEIVVANATGGSSVVSVVNGRSGANVLTFFAFEGGGYQGGLSISTGDLTGDGINEVIVGTANGASHVRAFDLTTGHILASFFAYAPGFNGGVQVSTVDSDGDGIFEIITVSGPGSSGHVRRFGTFGASLDNGFFAFDFSFFGGGFVG